MRSLPEFCNAFLDIVGSSHRVGTFDPDAPGADVDSEFGPMVRLLRREYPQPPFDSSSTAAELAVTTTALADGLMQTAEWMRGLGLV